MKRFKKLFSVVLVVLLIASSTIAFAAPKDVFNIDGSPYKKAGEMATSKTLQGSVATAPGSYLFEGNDGKLYTFKDASEAYNAVGMDFLDYLEDNFTPVEGEEPPVEDVEKWFIQLDTTAINDTIIANGDDNTTVIIEIVDEDGEVQAVNGIVIELSTSHGNFASAGQKSRVTLQNGKGTTKLNSEFSATPIAAELTAKLYEAAPEYQELIGKKEVIFNVYFKPLSATGLEAPPVLIAAESNQADRVTLFFDKEVDIEKFEKALAAEDKDEFMALSPATDFEVWQSGADGFDVIGYLPVPGNNKALVAILEVDANDNLVLRDNAWVEVYTLTYSDYGYTENEVEFLLTDARQPEFTEVIVDQDSMNQIRLKFSESISTIGAITIDGGIVSVLDWEINEYKPADWDEDDNFEPFEDYRSFVDVYIDGFLKAGDYSVTVTKAADWAGLTDPKNVSTTQTLEFTIAGSDTPVTWIVKVESPEQIRITFPKYVEFVDEAYGDNWWLEYEDDEDWEKVEEGMISTFKNTPEGTQIVLETIRDWTDYFNTDGTGNNYYNFPMQLHADEGVLRNTNNGKVNEEINFGLNYAGSPLNREDTTSPKNLDVIQEDEDVYNFDIVMDEPVKGRDIPINDDN
ncbi:MAG TPA: hypothetical protein VFC79_03375, partial [Tissierellaceae bacterium]|nr:hypothetical protein [Tissierellaceae bacterium]